MYLFNFLLTKNLRKEIYNFIQQLPNQSIHNCRYPNRNPQQMQKQQLHPYPKHPIQPQSRKQILSTLLTKLSQLNILSDLTPHQSLLNDTAALQSDNLHSLRRLPSDLIQNVPLKFNSIQHYREVWLGLFYQEAKAHIYRMKVQEAKQAELVEVMELRNYQNSADSGFKLFILQKLLPPNQQKSQFNIGSLVILSPVKPQPNINYPHIIGFIQQFTGPNTVSQSLLSVRAVFSQSVIKQRSQKQWELMTTTKKWYLQQICSINTIEREYYAIMSLEKIGGSLLEIVIRPDQHVMEASKKFRIPVKLEQKLKQTYNQSQYKAISECLKQSGITLIQGPPGTGKTKTVLGTLSVLLSSYNKNQQQDEPLILQWKKSSKIPRDTSKLLNPWLYQGYSDWRDQPYMINQEDQLGLTSCYLRCQDTDRKIVLNKKDDGVQLPEKVLICGPSNASVDQIIRKLIKEQLFGQQGRSFMPSFVRVGQHYDQSLKQYALDNLAQKLAQKQHGTDLNYYRSKILNEYRLVFATLSASGNTIMQSSNIKFDTVVIDEAGQSIQISNIIPLLYGCKRLILIGDPNQLPATVFSRKSIQHKYDQSLFQRLMKSGYPVNVLKTQYRMHPEISQVIGVNFYGQKLANWDKIVVEQPKATPCAFMIFNIDQSPQSSFNKSFRNLNQAKIVKDFALYLSKYYEDIGIVSPYSQQVSYIQSLIGPKSKKIQVKTIDSFQGRQKDVILFSAVRSRFIRRNKKIEQNRKKTIGFVADLRRINVSLSRAKNLCVVFADVRRLSINATWKNIINDAISKRQVYEYHNKKNYFQSLKQDPKKYLVTSLQ